MRKINENDTRQFEELTRQSVRDVLESMASIDLEDVNPAAFVEDPKGMIIGCVGFTGEVSGVICIHAGMGFAKTVTGRMLGIGPGKVEGEEMVNDAIGELSNMVAGSVKSRLCDHGWACTLTIPSIVRGRHFSMQHSSDIIRKAIGFRDMNDKAGHLLAELLLKQN